MGLLTVLRKVRQKERELRVLMVYVGQEGEREGGVAFSSVSFPSSL